MTSGELITSTSSQRMIGIRKLSGRFSRKKSSLTLLEGIQSCREALQYHPKQLRDFYITPEAADRWPETLSQARGCCYVHMVTGRVLSACVPQAQGICATLDLDGIADVCLEDLLRRGRADEAVNTAAKGFFLMMAHTQDPGNMGTMIRAASACAASGVIVCEGSVDPFHPKVIRTSVGTVFHMPVISQVSFEDACRQLKGANYRLFATAAQANVSLFDVDALDLCRSHVWVVGNEAHGLSSWQFGQCDTVVSIPLYGDAESLNVSQASLLCLYESARCMYGVSKP